MILNSLVVTLVVLLSWHAGFFYKVNPTTGISRTLCKIVSQGLEGVPIIPYTLGWPPLIRKALDLTDLDWNHFQHIWAVQFPCRVEGCEEEYTHTLVLAPWTWLVKNNHRSCTGVHTTCACDWKLIITWNRRVVVWLGSDWYMTAQEWCDHCNHIFRTLIVTGLSQKNTDSLLQASIYLLTCFKM